MTLYSTDPRTGEMTPLDLTPLRREVEARARQARRVRHVPRKATYRPRRYYSRFRPLDDLILGIGGILLACAILVTAA